MEAGRIGPNAILQLVDVLQRRGGGRGPSFRSSGSVGGSLPAERCRDAAGSRLRGGASALRRLTPAAEGLLEEAGLATGDYILAHRIPKLAQGMLRLMPGGLAAPLLTKAIARHSWTFAGTGVFRVDSSRPLVFRSHAIRWWRGGTRLPPQCIWHVGVFRRMYGRLVWPGVRVREVACCACGDPACRFEISAG